jgi:hypothetical protein
MYLSRAEWRKATRSSSNGGNCVEAASLPNAVAVRDSKNPAGPVLAFTPVQWQSFAEQVKAGRHDLG